MKNIIVGTAGHIDHGKTTLIRALTGRNTDRWEEEQRRGITIDLGFTWFDLPVGDRVGIIDVPGHERFINNMVAGVIGMDLVLLVIAADEGVMPQTREHLDILSLLGIEKCIVVLNKCDLVEEDWLELVREDVKEELKGTFCEHAPIAEVSAATGRGLPELIALIERMTREEVAGKDVDTIPRLPIDRVFSMSGFGTVITGTLISGRIRKEDTLEAFPIGKTCKIRSIQVHGQDSESCSAGQRVAINISNIKKQELRRGCVLAPPNSMKNTMMLDVRLNMLPSSRRTIENRTRLHLFTGTEEVLCRAVLMDAEELGPGDSGLVQLRLEEEIAVRRGDRFIVRFYSPMETIGGGVVIEANPQKKKRFDQKALKEMALKEEGGHGEMIELLVKQHSEAAVSAAEIARLTAISPEEAMEEIRALEAQGLIASFPMKKDVYLWHTSHERKLRQGIADMLTAFHRANPYKTGCRKAEIRMKLMQKVKPNVFEEFMLRLERAGEIALLGELVSLPGYTPPHDEAYEKARALALKAMAEAGYEFLKLSDIPLGVEGETAEDIAHLLCLEGELVRISDGVYTLSSLAKRAEEAVRARLAQTGLITIAELRDMLGTSRKNAKPLLEYLDEIKVTRRNGTESERIGY